MEGFWDGARWAARVMIPLCSLVFFTTRDLGGWLI